MKTSPADLLGIMPWKNGEVRIAQNTTEQVLRPNPKRAGLIMAFTAAAGLAANVQINVGISEDVDENSGIVLPADKTPLVFAFRDWGPFVCQGWWAKFTASGPSGDRYITWWEFEYDPSQIWR